MTDKDTELEATTTVVTVLLTGAFILPAIGIEPLLQTSFELFFNREPPSYFKYALGAVGSYTIAYLVLYVTFIRPVDCVTETNLQYSGATGIVQFEEYRIDPQDIKISDFVNVFLIFLIYEWIIWNNGLSSDAAFIGGFTIIVSWLIFQLITRSVGSWIRYDCWWTLKVILVAVPISVSLFIPAMWAVFAFT